MTLTSDSPASVVASRALSLELGGGGSIAGFTAESGFSLSGTLEDDSEVTITDTSGQSRFGVKPGGSAPLHLWDAEYGDESWSNLQRFSGTLDNQPLAQFTENLSAGNLQGSLKYNLIPDQNGYHVFGNLPLDQDVYPLNNLLVALRLRTNWDGTDVFSGNNSWNLKGIRHVSDNNAISTSVPLWGQAVGDGGPRSSGFGNQTIYEGEEVYGMTRFNGTWRTWEELVTFDYVGDTSVQAVEVDGTRQAYSGTIPAINSADAVRVLSMFQKQNAGEGNGDWGLASHYMATGYIYVDDSQCSVLISNKPSWVNDEDHERSICIPVSWAGDEIKFRLRKRTLQGVSGTHLYVRRAAGEVIKVGTFL